MPLPSKFNEPSEQYVRALIKNIYTGVKTQNVTDRFKELTRVAINYYITDLLNDKIQNFILSDTFPEASQVQKISEKAYSFLPEETETLDFVKNMLSANDISYKKTSRYAYMYISDSQYKWICRVSIKQENKLFILHKVDTTDYETEYLLTMYTYLSRLKIWLQLHMRNRD